MKKHIVFLSIGGLILYFFLFPVTLPTEYFFIADKAINLATLPPKNTPTKEEEDTAITPFRSVSYFGYLNKQFVPTFFIPMADRSVASKYYYTTFGDGIEPFTIKTAQNMTVARIEGYGVPFIFDKTVFVVNNDTGLVSAFSAAGQPLWQYDTGSFITSIDAQANTVILGLLDGNILFLNQAGEIITHYKPTGSAFNVVYGVSLSTNTKYASAVVGLDPQRFILFRQGQIDYTPIYHQELTNAFKAPVFTFFSPDSQFVFFQTTNSMSSYNLKTKQVTKTYFIGSLVDFNSDTIDDFNTLLSYDKDLWQLKVVSFDNEYPILNSTFKATKASIKQLEEDQFVLTVDDKLLLIKYAKER